MSNEFIWRAWGVPEDVREYYRNYRKPFGFRVDVHRFGSTAHLEMRLLGRGASYFRRMGHPNWFLNLFSVYWRERILGVVSFEFQGWTG